MTLVLAFMPSALAVHDDNLFELGGVQTADILGDGNDANGPDWADVFDASGTPVGLGPFGGIAAAFLADDLAQKGAIDRTTFGGAGGSNKNNDPISPADCLAHDPPLTGSACDTWHWDSGNNPAKDDLSNVYAYAAEWDHDSDPDTDPHLVIYAGFERLAPEGDSHIDVEFMQDEVALDEAVPCNDPGSDTTPCEFTGVRTEGDVIVSMDFVQGGGIGEVSIRQWDGDEYTVIETLVGEGCDVSDNACAFNNGGLIDGGPWPNYDRGGAVITQLEQNAFTEFGADLTALLGQTACFTTFMGKTRSSQSFTAELKDFAGPGGFNICGADISIAPDDVNEVGQQHTFTVTVNQKLGSVTSPAPDGTIVTVTLTGDADNVVDTCASPGTVNGQCTVTFDSDTPGTITGHAAADVVVGSETFHVETDGTGSNSDDAVKKYVDAYITIGPDDTNGIGESHTFTVTVKQDDGGGGGFVDVPDGTIVTVTLTGDADNVVDDCATGTVNGQCTVTFTSDTVGSVVGHASVTLTIEGLSVTRQTDGTGQNSGDATKNFVAGSLAWSKEDNAGRLQGGATFQVCRTHDRFGADITDECVSVTDNSAPDTDADAGEFLLTGLALGRYTVKETAAPAGYEPDPDTETVELTLANPDVTITTAFVNNRPIVKLSEFGYTNTPTEPLTDGVVSGTTVYTVKFKNFGGAAAALLGSLDVSTDSVGGTLFCNSANSKPIDEDPLDPNEEVTVTFSCTYTDLDDGSVVTADLDADYTINGLTRTPSGIPASISFTIQAD